MTRRIVDSRYELIQELGRGGQGTTYLARRVSDGVEVALKELELSRAEGWDSIAVFEREVGVLGGLTHPGIPRVIDSFETDGHPVLVQEFVSGQDLEKRLLGGEQFDEARLRSIAEQVLEVLAYLHRHNPPVLHRDVKPANLVQRDDGSVSLVDFGAAQGAQRGEAVIGSTGYMPAEQLMGRAVPVSDVYALAATIVRLATRKHPVELGDGLELKWRDYANLSEPFAAWLDRALQPVAEDRFSSSSAALKDLQALDRAHAIARRGEDNLALEFRTRFNRYRVFRRGAKLTVFCPISENEGGGITKITFAVLAWIVATAVLGWPFVVLVVAVWLIRRHDQALRLIGSPSGLDVVWRGTAEVVERIPLADLAGVSVENFSTLVLWRSSGKKIRLDSVYLRITDLRELESVLTAWLADARRAP